MSNEIEVSRPSDVERQIAALSGSADLFFSTFDISTPEGKITLFNATNDSDNIGDHLGETINLVAIAAMPVTVTSAETGEVSTALRTILIDDKGRALGAVSDVLYQSLQRLLAIFDHPSTWKTPLAVKVVEEKSGKGRKFYNLKLA